MPRARACAGDRAARTFRWESKTAGGKGGKGGNLQSFGNRGLFDDGATRRKPAETPCRNFARATGRIFLSHLGVHSSSQYRHRLRKLRKLLLPAGNDTAATRLLLL